MTTFRGEVDEAVRKFGEDLSKIYEKSPQPSESPAGDPNLHLGGGGGCLVVAVLQSAF